MTNLAGRLGRPPRSSLSLGWVRSREAQLLVVIAMLVMVLAAATSVREPSRPHDTHPALAAHFVAVGDSNEMAVVPSVRDVVSSSRPVHRPAKAKVIGLFAVLVLLAVVAPPPLFNRPLLFAGRASFYRRRNVISLRAPPPSPQLL